MSSKYDHVKVKVHLGDDHYYALSRFILSKMLTFCKLPMSVAVRVSLEVKKSFVDQEKLEISQTELEVETFLTMAQHGYGEAYARLFPVMTRFYLERVPLVILIAGSGYCGKTATAHSFASKLNTDNVVSTDVLLDILSSIHDGFPASSLVSAGDYVGGEPSMLPQSGERSLWLCETEREEDFVSSWSACSDAIRPLVEEEINKALTEGKVLIVEGSLLNLSLFRPFLLGEFQRCRAAILVAFYVTADDVSRQFAVGRFLSSRPALIPAAYRSDMTAAVRWMMQRVNAVEAVQWQSFTESGGGMRACWIDENNNNNEQPSTPSRVNVCIEGNEEIVDVHCVTYSVGAPSRPPEMMRELVLGRIMSELRQRQSL